VLAALRRAALRAAFDAPITFEPAGVEPGPVNSRSLRPGPDKRATSGLPAAR
jgi:hypothetical protein